MTSNIEIRLCSSFPADVPIIYLTSQDDWQSSVVPSATEREYIERQIGDDADTVAVVSPERARFFHFLNCDFVLEKQMEKARISANKIFNRLSQEKLEVVALVSAVERDVTLAFIEGLMLSAYRFDKYKSKKTDCFVLKVDVVASECDGYLELLKATVDGVFVARDLINEPVNALDAIQLSEHIKFWGNRCGFDVKTLHKDEIIQQRMGGLLAVNQGSLTPPTFSVLEWKHPLALGSPIVIIGKGVTFDTGGVNLKVQPGGLDDMKSDMAGAAAVIGTFIAVSKARLPIHLVGLIPATDNRPGYNAVVPGDIIAMHDGTTVEIMNTDAEGRLILADAISFAGQYTPELIVELSTLTGSTVMTLGSQGMAAMGSAGDHWFTQLSQSGNRVHERIAVFPFWEEYEELIQSEIADLKNIGGREAGAITAGKFLNHFTKCPFIHLDIAGVAFHRKDNGYRGQGATGVGVRLLVDFFVNISNSRLKER